MEILSSFVESRAASLLWPVGLKHDKQSIRKNGGLPQSSHGTWYGNEGVLLWCCSEDKAKYDYQDILKVTKSVCGNPLWRRPCRG